MTPVTDCLEQSKAPLENSGVTADDLAFMRRFESCVLTEPEWTHEAHVRAAWIALSLDPFAAIDRIRKGIQRFNAKVLGRPAQYHDTVTVAFATIIRSRLAYGESFDQFLGRSADILSPDRPLLLDFYSPARLQSPEARAGFVAPDRKPLPADTSEL